MSLVFNNIKILSQRDDPKSPITVSYLNQQNFISSPDPSLNIIGVNKILIGKENNLVTLNNKVSFISGNSNVLPNGNDNYIGMEKIIINDNESAIKRVLTSAQFGENTSTSVNDIEFDGCGNIYVGGRFETFGTQVVNNIFRYNTDGTITRCGMGTNIGVRSLLWDNSYNRLYVSSNSGNNGTFYQSDGTAFLSTGGAIYNPSTNTWSSFGTNNTTGGAGANSSNNVSFTYEIDYARNCLYVANGNLNPSSGSFISLGGVSVNGRICRVNRQNLTDISDVIANSILPNTTTLGQTNFQSMLLRGNKLYAGGNFSGSTGLYNGLLEVDITNMPSTSLSPIGLAAGSTGSDTAGIIATGTLSVQGMAAVGNDIYFGGNFGRTPSHNYSGSDSGKNLIATTLQRFAKFDTNTRAISPVNLTDFISGTINKISYDSLRNKILITGQFGSIGNIDAKGIVLYDISSGKYEQCSFGMVFRDFTSSSNSQIFHKIINNKYYIFGGFLETRGTDNGNSPFLVEIDPSKINNIYGSIINNGQNVDYVQQIYKGQMNRFIWNGTKWQVKNFNKF